MIRTSSLTGSSNPARRTSRHIRGSISHRSLPPTFKSRIADHFSSLVNALRFFWVVLLIFGEYITFTHRIHQCSWPGFRNLPRSVKPYRVLLIADLCANLTAQIPDHRSYPSRNWFLRWLGEKIIDGFLAKSWKLILWHHKPDAIIFLGDLLDSGMYAVDRLEHAHYVERFKQLFSIPKNKKTLYVIGNHDSGLHNSEQVGKHAREQFKDAFGPVQGVRELGNHSFIHVDAMALLEEKLRVGPDDFKHGTGLARNSATNFVRNLTNTYSTLPRILLSHIPLYRPPKTPCGKMREGKSPIMAGHGLNYQNLLDQDISDFLLEYTSPSMVFSGDDHDYCAVSHKLLSPSSFTSSVDEITLRAFGMNMGIRHPGYQLMSLYNPDPSTPPDGHFSTIETQPCLLPNQISVYLRFYLPFAIISLILVLIPKIRKALISSQRVSSVKHHRLPSHMGSFSRSSFSATKRRTSANHYQSDSSADSDVETYNAYSPSTPSYGYSYDEDGLPTPNSIYDESPTTSRPNLSKMRRVSRLAMWDGRGKQRNSIGNSEEFVSLLSRLGPIYRFCLRPVARLARRIGRTCQIPWVTAMWSKIGGDALLRSTIKDVWSVAWVAVVVYCLVYIRFAI